jgi:hypothetical protein
MLSTGHKVARFEREARFFIAPGGLLDLADCMTANWDMGQGSEAIKSWAQLINWVAYGQREVACRPFRKWTSLFRASKSLISKLYWSKSEVPGRRGKNALYETTPLSEAAMRKHLQAFVSAAYGPVLPGATTFIEDTSHSILSARRIKHWFPDAKIVWVVRDPYDVAICHNNARWGAGGLDLNAKRIFNILSRALQLKSDMDMLVRFEDLVTNTDATLGSVAKRLGISGAVPKRLDVSHVGVWKGAGPKTKRLLAKELGPLRKKIGYR